MTLIDALKANKIGLYVRVNENHVFSTIQDIMQIQKNTNFFEDFYDKFTLTHIENFNDYCTYLITKKFVDMEKTLPLLNFQNDDPVVLSLIANAKKAIKAIEDIENREVILFINSSYNDILQNEYIEFGVRDLFVTTIDYIIQFKTGIKNNVFEYICDNFSYVIIHHYDQFEKVIERNPDLFKKAFSDKNIGELSTNNLIDLLGVLEHIFKKDKSNLSNDAENVVQILYSKIEQLANDTTQDNVMRNESYIRNFNNFLKSIHHINANNFEKIYNKVNDTLKAYINTGGKTITTEVNISPIVEMINSDLTIARKILLLTHHPNSNAKKWEAILNEAPKEKHPLFDLVSTNIATNDYFTFTHQIELEHILKFGGFLIRRIFSDLKLFAECLLGYEEIINVIVEVVGDESKDLLADFELLSNMISNIFSLNNDDERIIFQSLCYGAAMFICAFIEKLLRYVYRYLFRGVKYIPFNKATLGELLADREDGLTLVLGEFQVKHLRFYLCGEKDSDIGYGFRNRLAHLNQVNLQSLSPLFVCELFYLLTSIMNSICLFFSKEEQDKDN